jgi:hypothetical protein
LLHWLLSRFLCFVRYLELELELMHTVLQLVYRL